VLYAEKNQSGQYAWKEAGQIDLDSEDKIDWVTIECGEEFCRCSHYAWVHFPQLEGTDIGIQQFLGRAPSIPANSLPETRAHHAMAEADPDADLRMAIACPECGHAWDSLFDPASYLWSELQAGAMRVLREVDALASAYGWSEREILEMPRARRRAYLALVTS